MLPKKKKKLKDAIGEVITCYVVCLIRELLGLIPWNAQNLDPVVTIPSVSASHGPNISHLH